MELDLDLGLNLKSKFIGALIGSAIGDALGAPVEGYSESAMKSVKSVYGDEDGDGDEKRGEWKTISLRYTDDTEMMIGVAESLVENRGFNGEHMALKFIENYDVTRGYSPGVKEVLRRLRLGESWKEASKKLFDGVGSWGNGAAMRVAPIGIFYHDDAEDLREIAYKSSIITHSHELGKEGAALQAYCIALAVQGNKEDMPLKIEEFTNVDVYRRKIRKIRGFLEKDTAKKEIISELGNGEEAFNSVPTAFYSFLRSTNFENAVLYAISLGGDTDTIGAMTGAISGAYYGMEAIPRKWEEKLEKEEKGRDYIRKLAEKLYYIKY